MLQASTTTCFPLSERGHHVLNGHLYQGWEGAKNIPSQYLELSYVLQCHPLTVSAKLRDFQLSIIGHDEQNIALLQRSFLDLGIDVCQATKQGSTDLEIVIVDHYLHPQLVEIDQRNRSREQAWVTSAIAWHDESYRSSFRKYTKSMLSMLASANAIYIVVLKKFLAIQFDSTFDAFANVPRSESGGRSGVTNGHCWRHCACRSLLTLVSLGIIF